VCLQGLRRRGGVNIVCRRRAALPDFGWKDENVSAESPKTPNVAKPNGSATQAQIDDPAVTDSAKSGFTRQMNESSGSFELVLSGVILGVGGYFLDVKLGTTPIFLLLFTLLGVAGAAISIYYRYRHQISTLQEETQALKAAAAETGRS